MDSIWEYENPPFSVDSSQNDAVSRPSISPVPPPSNNVPVTPQRRLGIVHFRDDDKLASLRIALRHKDAYGAAGVSDTKFWRTVSKEVAQLNGRPPHTTLARTITKLVQEREKELQEEGSGRHEGRSDLQITLDEWIDIVHSRQNRDDARRERRTRIDGESTEAIAFRQSQMSTWTDWRQLNSLTPSDSLSPSISLFSQDDESETPGPSIRKRRRKATSTLEDGSFEEDFHQFVQCYVSRRVGRELAPANGRDGAGETRLGAVEDKLDRLEEGVSELLRLMRNTQGEAR